jgi:exodeoxyribonuclease V alpha subunit
MIDVNLFNSLLNGLRKNVKLVLIGDYNQLESVGPGNILKDLIDSNKLNVIKLDELYRQEENSYINILAKEINDGNLTYDFNSKKKDFSFISSEKYNVKKYIKEVIIKALDKGYTLNDIQVLCPMYKGYNGIDNLNKYIQELLNKDEEKSIKYLDVVYKKNDKVLQLENDPNNNVFNGDIGYIIDIDKNVVTIDFDGNVVKYTSKDLNMIKHAYAISIHKAQGSEFNIVIIPIVSEYRIMLYKKLIYTGITRAKKSLILIGEKDAFIYSIKNNNLKERRTILKDKLIECIN